MVLVDVFDFVVGSVDEGVVGFVGMGCYCVYGFCYEYCVM